MAGLLNDLGGGLISAGAALNPLVMQGQQRQQQIEQENKLLMARQMVQNVIQGVQSGAIPADQGRAALQRMGLDIPIGPDIQTQQRQLQMTADQQFMQGLGTGGITGFNPASPMAMKYAEFLRKQQDSESLRTRRTEQTQLSIANIDRQQENFNRSMEDRLRNTTNQEERTRLQAQRDAANYAFMRAKATEYGVTLPEMPPMPGAIPAIPQPAQGGGLRPTALVNENGMPSTRPEDEQRQLLALAEQERAAKAAVPTTSPVTPATQYGPEGRFPPVEQERPLSAPVMGAEPTPAAPIQSSSRELTLADAPRDLTFRGKQQWLLSQSKMGGGQVPGDFSKTGEEFLKTIPQSDAATVKAIAEGRQTLLSLSTRNGYREYIARQVNQYDKNFDQGVANARFATRKDFTSGPTSRNVTAINTAIGHIGTMNDLGEKLANRDLPAINAIANQMGLQLGDAAKNNYEIAQGAVADELMRVFRQVGASQVEADHWRSKFTSAQSPAQMKGAMKTAAELLGSRIESINDQWKRGMNTKEGYPDLLSPKSKETFRKVGADLKQFGIEAPSGSEAAPPSNIRDILNIYREKGAFVRG